MLCTPADHPFDIVHIIPAQIQDCAEPLEGMSMSEGTIVVLVLASGRRPPMRWRVSARP